MTYQNTLYTNLMKLVEDSQQEKRATFTFKDVDCVVDPNFTYRIFNYQLPKYSDFLKEAAMQCRGTMFRINKETKSFELVSLPMDKFFGLGENPSTMNIQPEDINSVSLMYRENENYYYKSMPMYTNIDGYYYCTLPSHFFNSSKIDLRAAFSTLSASKPLNWLSLTG